MISIRPWRLVGVVALGLVASTGCSGGSSSSTPTTTPTTTPPVTSAAGVTFPPDEVAVWQCQDGRQLRREGNARWGYEGTTLTPGGADDPQFLAELFRCHGRAIDGEP
jgi:hypothetical protein